MMFSFRKIFKYVWPQMRKRKWVFFCIVVVFSSRVFFGEIVIPLYFKKIIDIFSKGLGSPEIVSYDIYKLLFIIIGIHILVFFIARIIKFVLLKFEVDVIRDLRNFAFQKIENHSQTFFANTFAGSLVTKARRFVGGFEITFEIFLYNFLKFFVKRKVAYDLSEAEQDSRISGRLADVFSNILAVKFFSARSKEIDSFGKYTAEGAKRSKKASFMGAKIDLIQHLLIICVQGITLYLVITLWLQGQISTGTVVLIETYMVIVSNNLWEFGNSLTRFMKSIADMQEMVDIFEIIPDILDPKNPEALKMKEGRIIFHNVSFKYQMGEEVLTDFSLDIMPGERVGIVGHSGAGKSTITKLLLRFNDITEGRITIDGQDIRNVTQDDLRSVISYVPQEPILFHRPIKENINYGKIDASQEEVIDVAIKAHADDFISKLPKGYDTLVGERGVKLSGGERQRVAIARAMLKDSPILMLDEATSSLDSISESYIQDAFTELMKGKTTI